MAFHKRAEIGFWEGVSFQYFQMNFNLRIYIYRTAKKKNRICVCSTLESKTNSFGNQELHGTNTLMTNNKNLISF